MTVSVMQPKLRCVKIAPLDLAPFRLICETPDCAANCPTPGDSRRKLVLKVHPFIICLSPLSQQKLIKKKNETHETPELTM